MRHAWILFAALAGLAAGAASASVLTFSSTAGSTAWSSGANWLGGTAPTNDLTSDIAQFDGTSYAQQPAVDAARSVNGIQIGDGSTTTAALTLSANNTLTLGNNGIVMSAHAGAATISGAGGIALGAAQSWTNNSSSLLTISANVVNGANLLTVGGSGATTISGIVGSGGGGLAKTGTGTLTLSGTNTYTGTTSITNGTIYISSDANLGAAPGTATAGSLVIDSNGTLAVTQGFTLNTNRGIKIGPTSGIGSGTIEVASGQTLTYGGIITSNGVSGTGGLTKTGAGTLTLSGVNAYTGDTLISAGTIRLGNAAALPSGSGKGNLTVNGTLDLYGFGASVNGLSGSGAGIITSGAAGAITLTAGNNNASGSFSGAIQNGSGTLTLAKAGTGTLTLGGNNTFTGGVTIGGGTLQLANLGALNSSIPNSVTFGAAAPTTTRLQLNGNSVTIGALATNATPGTVVIENASASAATLTVSQSANSTFAGILQNGAGGGALSVTKTGTGTLTLSGANIYTGTTTISAGALQAGSALSLPSGAGTGNVILNGGAAAGLLDINGYDLTINGLSGTTGAVLGKVVNNRAATVKTITVGSGDASTTFAGLIANNTGTGGTLNLAKTGTGTLTLSNANTYTGTTIIKNGAIILGAASALPTTTVLTLGDGTTNTSGVLQLNGFAQTLTGLAKAGTGTGNRIINGSATAVSLTLAPAVSSTFAGILGGPGLNESNFNLVMSGAGTLTLSGSNTYTGTTAINAGTLSISALSGLGGGATAVTLGGGILSYTGNGETFSRGLTVTAAGGELDTVTAGNLLTVATGGIATSGAFTVGGSGNTAISSAISGTGSLTKTGSGTLTVSGINSYGGATMVKYGTLALGAANSIPSGTTVTLGDSSANTSGTLRLDGNAQTLAGLATTGNGTANRVTGGNAALSALTISTAGATSFSGILGGGGTNENNLALIKSGTGTLTLSGVNTYLGGATVSNGVLSVGRDNNLGGATNSITLNGGTLSANSSFTLGSAHSVLLGPSSGSSSGTIDVTSGTALTYGGVIASNGSGTGSLIKSGAGTLTLSGTSTYTGTTTILEGYVALGTSNALPVGTSLTLGGSITSGILKLNGKNQELAGLVKFGGGTNRVVNGSLTASTLTLNIPVSSTLAAILGGPGNNENNFSLVKSGSGTLTLSGSDTYTGNTTISAGVLALGSAAAIPNGTGNGNVQVDGTLDVNGKTPTINGLSGSGVILNNGATGQTISVNNNNTTSIFSGTIQDGTGTLGINKVTAGTLTLSGSNSYSGLTTVTAGVLKLNNLSAIPFGTGKGNVSLTGALDLNGNSITINGLSGAGGISSGVAGALTLSIGENNANGLSYTGVISNGSGTVSLVKIGTGTQTLGGSNTYTGTTIIKNGTLALGSGNNRLPVATTLTLGDATTNTSGILSLSGRSQTVAGLATAGTGTGNHIVNGSGTAVTLTYDSSANSTFDGILGGPNSNENNFALAKNGTGTLTLSGNNTFTNGVTINTGGVLQLANAGAINATGTNTVTFGSGATAATKLQLNGNSVTIAGLQTNTTAGSPIVENGASGTATLTINNSATYTYASAINDGAAGVLALVKSGTGTQTLTGTSSYTGGTTISGGTLAISKDVALGATGGQLSIGNGTLKVTATITSSPRNIALTDAYSTIVVDPGVTYTEAGVISGSGTLNKAGTGVLQISGTANDYSGGTVVGTGLLNVTATSGTPLGANSSSNNVTVTAGANLSLSSTSNKGGSQTITVNSTSGALGGIGTSNTGLTAADLTGMIIDGTGSYGGVLGLNSGISYNSAINLSTFGSGAGQGYWFLGSASTGTFGGALTVGAGSTYRLGGGAGTLTISANNVLSGNNDLQVGSGLSNGNGSVILSGTHSFTGKTTVTGGAVLSYGSATAGDGSLGVAPGSPTPGKLVLDNGTLQLRATGTLNANRGIAVGPSSGSGAGTIDTNGYNLTYAGIIANNVSGTGTLTKINTGTLTLSGSNSYSGATNLNGGTVVFSALNNLGADTAAISFNGGTLQYAAGLGVNAPDITARAVTTTSAGGATIDTNGNNVTFGTSAITGTGLFTKNGTGTLTMSATNTYSGATTIGAGTVTLGTDNAIPYGTGKGSTTVTGTLDLNNHSPTLNSLSGAGTVTNFQSGTVGLTVDTTNGNSTFSGALNNGNGTVSLTKIGSNTLTLSGGSSTYSGVTTISVGSLAVTSDAALGFTPNSPTPGSITIASGATLASTTNDVTLSANRGIAINGATAASISVASGKTLTYNGIIANAGITTGGLTKSSTGTLVLGGSNTYAGDTTISSGTLKVANAYAIPYSTNKGNVSLAGTLDLNGNAITINGLSGAGSVTSNVAGAAGITVGANDQSSTFSGAITNGLGTVSLAKTGTGTLTLSGNSSYTGTTTISSGKISVSNLASGGNLGSASSPVVLGGASTVGALYYTGASASFTRGLTVNAGGGEVESFTAGTLLTVSTGGVDLSSGGSILFEGAGNTAVSSVISGSGGVTKAAAGTLTLSGSNSYSGLTDVQGGTLQIGNVAAVPSGIGKGNLSLATGTTLDLNNFSPTVNGLTGTGTVTNSLNGAVLFTAGGGNATSSFGGVIQDGNGTVAFAKIGSGTLTLVGANSYSGDTTVSVGTLEIANVAALPSGIGKGNVIVNGTLDLDNSLTVNGLSGSGTISTDTASAIVLTAGANDQTSTFAGNILNGSSIGGTLALTKTGTGTLTLSGTSSYSGATTISTGTLAMGSSTGLSGNSTVTISTAGTLDVNGYNVTMDGLLGTGTINNNGASNATLTAGAAGSSSTFGGVIADGTRTLSLNKSGSGTLTLTGVNTYSGTTTISNGAVSAADIGVGGKLGTGSSPIILGDATNTGTLSYTGSADQAYTRGFTVNAGGGGVDVATAGKTLTLQTGAIITAGTFTVGGNGNAIVQSVISGSGGLTKANAGSMVLSTTNTYSGDTTISTGILQVTDAAAIPSGSGKGNVAIAAAGTLDVNNLSLTVNGLSGAGTVTNSLYSPVTFTVGGNNASALFTGIVQDGNGTISLAKIGSGTETLGGVNTYSGSTTISAGTLKIGNAAAIPYGAYKGNLSLASAGTLDLGGNSITVNGLSGSGTLTNSQGASILSAGANDQTSTFSGNILDGAGTIGLTKAGTGILTLSGTSTFSGATTIAQGTLSMGSNAGLSSHSTLTINNGGALDLNGKVIAIDGLAGTGSITNNSVTSVILTTGASGGSGSFGGTIDDGLGTIGLTKTGTGTVTLTRANSYSGGTTVTGGLLAITSYGALGAIPASPTPGNIVLNGGGISATNTFEINANRGIAVGPASGSGYGILDAALNQTLTYNGIIANNGSSIGGLTKTGLGTVTLGGSNSYSGDTVVSAGSLKVGGVSAIPYGDGKGNLVLNSTLDLNNTSITVNGLSGSGTVSNTGTGPATLTTGANNQTGAFGGVIENGSGTTSLAKTGTGLLTLTGTSTYTGTTTILQGVLSISQDRNLGADPTLATPGSLVIDAGASLTATETFTLNANRGIAVGPTGAGTIDVLGTKTLTYGGVIANNGGTGGFTKAGTGTLILTGTSSYTGTTTVEAGVLTVNGSIAGSGTTIVKTGATLTGTGTTGAMTVDSNGTLSPGNFGIGTLGVSTTLTLTGNADFEMGTPGADHAHPGISDRVNVTGDIYLGGNLNLTDNAGANSRGSVGPGSYKLFTYTGSTIGSFATVSGLPAYHWALHDVTADKAIYVDMYNYAVATVTPAVNLGRIHAGGDFGTRTLTVANTTAAGDFTESLAGSFGTPDAGITATGSVTGMAGGSSNGSSMIVGISDNTAGEKSGSVAVNFTSQAVAASGLADTALAPQTVAVTGFAYTGQGVWNIVGGGSWGNNADAFGNWTYAGGVPGLDGTLSANDTATFGGAISAPATISLNGANPSLSAVTFNNASYSYTVARGTGGALTLKGNGGPASVTDANGSHEISAPMILAGNSGFAVSHAADTLTLSGTLSGNGFGITKTGAGTLAVTGSGTYTGATTVNDGVLKVNGSLLSTAAVNAGAILTGSGTVGGATIENGGTLAPGDGGVNNGVGALSVNGNVLLNSGGAMQWQLDTVSGTGSQDGKNLTGKSPGFDFLQITGELTLNATAQNPFLLDITGIGGVTGWNPASSYSWTIATASAVHGFNANAILIKTDKFTDNNAVGPNSFSVTQSGGSIILNYVPEPGTLGLLAIGALALLGHRRNRR